MGSKLATISRALPWPARYLPPLWMAFLFRVTGAQSRSLWYDDVFSILLAQQSLPAIVQGTAVDTESPFFYILLHFWQALVGNSPLALRMLNILLGMLVVVLAGILARRFFGERAVTSVLLLTGCAPFLVYHAQEVRMYTPLLLGITLYVYGIARWLGDREGRAQRQWAVATTVGASLALYSQPLAPLTLCAPFAWLLFRRRFQDVRRLATATAIAALLYAPWFLLFLPRQLEKVSTAFWTQPPGIVDLIQLPIIWLTGLPLPGFYLPVALSGAVLLTVLIGHAHLRSGESPRSSYLLFLLLLPVALTFLLSHLLVPLFVARALIFGNVAFLLLLGWLLERAPASRRNAALIAVLLLMLPGLLYHYRYDGLVRSPYPTLIGSLRERASPDSIILHDNKVLFFPSHFYDMTLTQSFLADKPDAWDDNLAHETREVLDLHPITLEQVEPSRRVWFVAYDDDIRRAEARGSGLEAIQWLDGHRARLEEFTVGGIRVIHYEEMR